MMCALYTTDPCSIGEDQDYDGVKDNCDNCIFSFNPNQENDDDDSTGNACDEDDDNDKIGNWTCTYFHNL